MHIFCDKRPRCCILICIRLTGMFSTDVSDMRPRQQLLVLFCWQFCFSIIVALYLCFLMTKSVLFSLFLCFFNRLQWHRKVATPNELSRSLPSKRNTKRTGTSHYPYGTSDKGEVCDGWLLLLVTCSCHGLSFSIFPFFRTLKNASHPANPPPPDAPNKSLVSAVSLFSGVENGELYFHCWFFFFICSFFS